MRLSEALREAMDAAAREHDAAVAARLAVRRQSCRYAPCVVLPAREVRQVYALVVVGAVVFVVLFGLAL